MYDRRFTWSGAKIFQHGRALLEPQRTRHLRRLPLQPNIITVNDVTSQTFQRDCQRELLSHQIVTSGILSQVDFATFVNSYCVSNGACDPSTPPRQFDNLNINIQLSFVWSICPQGNATAQVSCLEQLRNSGQDFGFVITSTAFSQVAKEVSSLCRKIYPLLQEDGLLPTNGKCHVH